jgi:hypothetical protein
MVSSTANITFACTQDTLLHYVGRGKSFVMFEMQLSIATGVYQGERGEGGGPGFGSGYTR